MQEFINLAYIAASILFIFGIKMLGNASTARRGNFLSSLGMLLAVVVTLLNREIITSYSLIVGGLALGASIGFIWAKKVQMTGMPELVALFNGFGGLASLLVGWAEYARGSTLEWVATSYENPSFTVFVIVLAILIGGITFTGSIVAYLKLSGKMGGSPTNFPGQNAINASLFLALLGVGVFLAVNYASGSATIAFYTVMGIALLLGILGVIPIGGGDMPVVISFLNSCSGLAAAAAGFVILNNVLIVAGCLVGASGLILTVIMCKAMNRTLGNVFFAGFGGASSSGTAVEGEMKAITIEDAYYVLEAATSVVVVPGYGMAVAQAQHAVKELGSILEDNGCEVRYAIHPVAGRMPGHMNVLLAEADVPYEQLCEMDAVNPIMPTVDVAIVIGANDVVNPAASEDESSPIYGMPIINVFEAKTVFALKRGQGAGFSGLVNTLFFRENTRMLYGDAKATVSALVSQFDE
ncbi:NAD(P)(+) transhydrogenase (Re/Si-specific) subunit beta [bacterium]|jgi:NAD(P) transhydrogenase subunit beta|nr:NAD(P)(+) transhydrogenase (Re/Si-specific) subunit beta [Verrucomicrobiales bacterium]MDA7643896.1 NAD(P)(+) transhydrogenase (Re/Si-specific) subunit beta [Verrucomicrobiales bacterium]MDC0502669.1 NAD(P)(+) transhydrogenase (Re/Si-specific) subunit beta [Verrucomicrobiales bacterium]MDC3254786.1 NAD(P)(+) transhydrogenase (Re/Si-specific) subunit beta [bacterium]MDF1784896.1 NAD(P)(+) transhydrogenase (Re/Si-specific) subunit beta [Verrucomicrobiales bacterium]